MPSSCEIRSGIRGQVRRGQDGDVLKCRARKGCSFDLASDLPASRVSKFSRRGGGGGEKKQRAEKERGRVVRRNCQRWNIDRARRNEEETPVLSGMNDAERRAECNCWTVEVCARRHRQKHFCRDSPRSFACLSPM